MSSINSKSPHALEDAYSDYLSELWMKRSKAGAAMVFCATPTGLVLDHFIYREHAGVFLIIRLLTMLIVGVIFGLHFARFGKKYVKPLAFGWMIMASWHINAMIGISQGIISPYYIGLILLILCTGIFIPWTFKECLQGNAMILLMYLVSCSANWFFGSGFTSKSNEENGPQWIALAVNNGVFLLLMLGINCVGCYIAAGYRFTEFKLRFDLDQNKKELEESYKKLDELDKVKSRFFANISHELRTPLTLILSPMDELRSHSIIQRDIKFRETLDMMFGNAMRLLALINDLLDLIRLEDRRLSLHIEPVELRTLLPALVGSMRGAATRAKLDLQIEMQEDAPLIVAGDKDRLEKVFINLIFNAIKFTPEGGSIQVVVTSKDESVCVEIKDTGIGIAQEKIGSVFDRFWQDETSLSRTKQGTGIGLALVKELVELHKGKVTVSSIESKGTTFTVSLPAYNGRLESESQDGEANGEAWLSDLYRKAQHYQGELAATHTEIKDTSRKNILKHTLLLVEDEVDMQRFLVRELSAIYNVEVAPDGETGYEMAIKYQPKLVLTDMMLPKMDGVTLCRKIKNSPSVLPTKVVLLTARADDKTKIEALEAGVDDFLAKPFSLVELKTRLANLLLTGQLERELQNQNQMLEKTLQQLKATEAQLVQSEKLSALGNLSAGIMHEINNPVNFMLTAVHFLRGSISSAEGDAKEAIDDIEGGLKRVRDIIADLKSFAYNSNSSTKSECDPEKILRTTKRLMAHDIKDDVKLEEIVVTGSRVYGNENQLVQLLVNLIQNALHATAKNSAVSKERRIRVKLAPENNYFVLSVWDNGVGISKENLSKIFDPFFTTKNVGEGMGMGLSVSQAIVKQHNGEMNVNSELGQFAEFVVRLPLTAARWPDQPELN